MGEALNFLFNAFILCLIVALLGLAWFIYSLFAIRTKTIESKEKPSITWKLEAKGQKVDTIWIYKFK